MFKLRIFFHGADYFEHFLVGESGNEIDAGFFQAGNDRRRRGFCVQIVHFFLLYVRLSRAESPNSRSRSLPIGLLSLLRIKRSCQAASVPLTLKRQAL